MTSTDMLPKHAIEAIRERRPFDTGHTIGRITPGGTYIISTAPARTDTGKPNDLVAILPSDIGQGQILRLWIAVNPAFIECLQEILDGTLGGVAPG